MMVPEVLLRRRLTLADPNTHGVTENVLQPSGRYQERAVGPGGPFRPSLLPDLEIDLTRIFA